LLERAIARDPGRLDLRRRAVALAMRPGLARPQQALEHLERLTAARPEDGELRGLLGECKEALAPGRRDPQGLYKEARAAYEGSIKLSPDRVDSYVRLAALLRGPLGDPTAADAVMGVGAAEGRGLVAANPKSARAYLARARY